MIEALSLKVSDKQNYDRRVRVEQMWKRRHALSFSAICLLEHVLRLVDFARKIGRSSSIGVIGNHNLAMCILDLVSQSRAVSRRGDGMRPQQLAANGTTYFKPSMEIASLRSIFDLKPPLAH